MTSDTELNFDDTDSDRDEIEHTDHDDATGVRTTPRIGVRYFPEHWLREQWERDVDEMVEASKSR